MVIRGGSLRFHSLDPWGLKLPPFSLSALLRLSSLRMTWRGGGGGDPIRSNTIQPQTKMIVRTYARRTREIGRSFSDPALLDDDDVEAQGSQDFPDFPLSQESSQDRFNFAAGFSSQDSSPWSLDPDSIPPLPTSNSLRRLGKPRNSSRKVRDAAAEGMAPPAVSMTATLMEAQEFGEMMEHVDEVNFALDGLRSGQPARIRRASLLSLLSICGTAQQRRLLRAQGWVYEFKSWIFEIGFFCLAQISTPTDDC